MSTTPHPPTTKYELMRRVQAEDTEAFGVLYDRLAPKALRVAYAVGVDRDRAQKAVQEAFCRSGVAAPRIAPRPVRCIAGRWTSCATGPSTARDATAAMTAGGRISTASLRDTRRPVASKTTRPIAKARRLRAVLAHLPMAQREVIALAYFGELTHSEIAHELSLPLGTVKGRMRLGLKRLPSDHRLTGRSGRRRAAAPRLARPPRRRTAAAQLVRPPRDWSDHRARATCRASSILA